MTGSATADETVRVRTRGTVTIEPERCKGCELCIPACPPQVLTMSAEVNRMGFHVPELHAGCTGCAACLLVCPDFVFEVFRYDEPMDHTVTLDAAQEAR